MTRIDRALSVLLLAGLLAGSASAAGGAVEYRTEPRYGHVIFIENHDALGAREAAEAAGLKVRSLPELAAEAAAASSSNVSITDPEQAEFAEFLKGLQSGGEAEPAAAGTTTTQPAGAAFWEERDRRSLNDHAGAIRTADAFLAVHGQAFGRARPGKVHTIATPAWKQTIASGVASGPHSALVAYRAEKDHLGMTHVRYEQRYKGVPVFGSEAIVHVNALGQVATANGIISADLPEIDMTPAITADQAAALAETAWHADPRWAALPPQRKHVRLLLFQPGMLDNTSDPTAYLVWDVRLVNEKAWVDEDYFVDSVSGKVVRELDNVRRIYRKVYDCSYKPGTDICGANIQLSYDNPYLQWTPPPTAYTFGCNESYPGPNGPNPRYLPEESTDTDDLFSMLMDIHDYYLTKFGRNGANGQGGNTDGSRYPIDYEMGRTYMDWVSTWGADCMTAGYLPSHGVLFCKGMMVPDLVGHEYAHGVNDNLVYSGQSGTLDESHSDVVSEMFEFYKTGSNDWVFGGEFPVQWVRNLADPPSLTDSDYWFPYPDTFYSPNVYCGSYDNGGIHHNSTIPSKALYLASMGGAFNGCTIIAIGREKVEQILYRAVTQHYSALETFNGAYLDLIQSCGDLYGPGSEDCQQLTKALQSVELDQPGLCADPSRSQWHPPYMRDVKPDLQPDFHVDAADLELFVSCASGPGAPHNGSPLCHEADFDADADVDQDDFGILQRCFSGPDTPADPAEDFHRRGH